MSDAFTGEGNQSQSENTQTSEQSTNYIERLVAERGQHWADPQNIAKGKIEADEHIRVLTGQLNQAKEDLSRRDYAKELLEQLKAQESTPSATPSTATGGTKESSTEPDLSGIEDLVESLLTKKDRERIAQANVSQVNAKLEEAYGTEASAKVKEKATQLGISVERMKEIAAESPAAFFGLMGEPAKTTSEKPVVKGTLNTASTHGSSEKGWSYYQELRRKDPHRYYTPAIQNEVVAARAADPDFFNK